MDLHVWICAKLKPPERTKDNLQGTNQQSVPTPQAARLQAGLNQAGRPHRPRVCDKRYYAMF